MYSKTTRNLIFFGVIAMILAFSFRACAGDRMPDLINNLKIGSLVKNLDSTVHFYGRVVDQFSDPVGGAEVSVGIRRFSLIGPFFMGSKNLKVITDRDGYFEVFQFRGSQLFIGKITREGYEFDRTESSNSEFTFKGLPGEPVFIPDKDRPVIFRLRKKLFERTFLFEKPMWAIQVLNEESGVLKGTDFIEGQWSRMPGEKPRDSRSENCDLFFRAAYDEETEKWQVVLKPGGPNGGILVSDQMLFLAPEVGYEAEWSFIPIGHELPDRKYIYIRSRSPAVFSRIEITYVNATERFFRLSGKVATNPYGDRVLDAVDFPPYSQDPEIKRIYALKKRLEAEARAALREGRLPARPKIMALIEAAKRGEE